MKKIIILIVSIFFIGTFSFAQNVTKTSIKNQNQLIQKIGNNKEITIKKEITFNKTDTLELYELKNLTLKGATDSTQITNLTIIISSCENISFQNLKIGSNNIEIIDSKDIQFTNCIIENNELNCNSSENINFTNFKFNKGKSLNFTRTVNINFLNSSFYLNNGAMGLLDFEYCDNIKITDCKFIKNTSNNYFIYANNPANSATDLDMFRKANVLISNCYFKENDTYRFGFLSFKFIMKNNIFINNKTENNLPFEESF